MPIGDRFRLLLATLSNHAEIKLKNRIENHIEIILKIALRPHAIAKGVLNKNYCKILSISVDQADRRCQCPLCNVSPKSLLNETVSNHFAERINAGRPSDV